MKSIMTALCLVFFCSFAQAQEQAVDPSQDILTQAEVCDAVRKHAGTAELQNNFNVQDTQNVVGFPIDIPLQLDLQKTQFAGFLPSDVNAESVLTRLKIHANGTVEFAGDNVKFVPDDFCQEGVVDSAVVSRSTAELTNEKDVLNNPDILTGTPKAAAPVPATIIDRGASTVKAPPPAVSQDDVERVPQAVVAAPKSKPTVKPPPVKQEVDLPQEKGEILEGSAN